MSQATGLPAHLFMAMYVDDFTTGCQFERDGGTTDPR